MSRKQHHRSPGVMGLGPPLPSGRRRFVHKPQGQSGPVTSRFVDPDSIQLASKPELFRGSPDDVRRPGDRRTAYSYEPRTPAVPGNTPKVV